MTIFNESQKNLADKIEHRTDKNRWTDWKWQARHVIRDLDSVERLLGFKFGAERRRELETTLGRFPMSITPYYLSLVDREDPDNCPVFRQAVPSPEELVLESMDMADPLAEDLDMPVPGLTHRYPDRVLFHVSNLCAMYCRHCTRKRKVGDRDHIPSREDLELGISYVEQHPEVRDVLLSGGDPLMLPDSTLDWLLGRLSSIKHVEIIRIGTRTPVVLPYRITDELVAILKKYHPLWINTHFNHPREITSSSKAALARLADAGFPLGNQSVLLAGVNDCPRIIKDLVRRLVANRVRPYYLYQCDLAEGLSHFRTPVGKGIEIMESLIGHTTGFSVPTYVVDAPGGGGKIPLMPNYILSWSTNKVVLRNFEGMITTYEEPASYESRFCDRRCKSCNLQLKLSPASEVEAVGIEKLLADYDDTISLIPDGNERTARRLEREDEDA